jgi:hypothetical protein
LKKGVVHQHLCFFFFFLRDADEIETWMLEKLQLAQEENYKVKHFYFYTFLIIVLSLRLYFHVNDSNRYRIRISVWSILKEEVILIWKLVLLTGPSNTEQNIRNGLENI